MTGHIL